MAGWFQCAVRLHSLVLAMQELDRSPVAAGMERASFRRSIVFNGLCL